MSHMRLIPKISCIFFIICAPIRKVFAILELSDPAINIRISREITHNEHTKEIDISLANVLYTNLYRLFAWYRVQY